MAHGISESHHRLHVSVGHLSYIFSKEKTRQKHSPATTMRLSTAFLLLALGAGANAQGCGWYLNGNDCLCMNSATGAGWTEWTNYCCNAMGRKAGGFGPVCNVDQRNRQTFKDCCKFQDRESLIGHCR
ncbi:hypothetical protein RB601_005455 [Gaeumannomyces tritici]